MDCVEDSIFIVYPRSIRFVSIVELAYEITLEINQ